MGIDIYFSNQLALLADRLHENLTPRDDPVGIFDPPMVIVPNMNISKWIKLTFARKSGICMNVDFQYLEAGLWRIIHFLNTGNHARAALLENHHLNMLLFFVLMASDAEDDVIAPVNHYLHGTGAVEAGDLEIRSWQLARHLTQLFQEYEYHRADMIRRWRSPDVAETDIADAMERCQCRIYRKILDLKGALRQPVYTLAEYASTVLTEKAIIGNRGASHSAIHFFGLSQISPLHLSLLDRLKAHFEIHIYSLNPSREFWEDIKTPAEKKWIARKNVRRLQVTAAERLAGELAADADHALLSIWGKPGRESIRMLCQLTDYDFHAGFAEIQGGESVLGAIAHQLLTLEDGRGTRVPMRQDTSLQIMACPGIRREVETVYDSILHNLETDPDLCMTDIAVMVTDMAQYKPVMDAVFNMQPQRISYNLVDASARRESVFAQAVLAIMALSGGHFTRKQVFDLLRNPCVMHRWGFGPHELGVWIGWADALGIFHGFENAGGNGASIPAAGLYSWRQGLERLRMSRIMTVPDNLCGLSECHFKGIVPYNDTNTGDERLIEKFCDVVEALHDALASLQMASAPAQAWRDRLVGVIDRLVGLSPSMPGEVAVCQSLIQALDNFVLYDDLMQVQPGRPLTLEALRVFVGSHLDGLSGGRGDYLTGGVTVSALMPMRPIPFKVVYVLGLEEGRFPGQTMENGLDLRCRQRRIGDTSPVDRNRYLFLEILISVRRKLYLSYVSRDLQKDREQAPCSVVHQLRHYVETHVLGGTAFRICQVPVAADSQIYIEPDAVNDWSDTLVNTSVSRQLSCYRRMGLWDPFIRRATPGMLDTATRHQPDFSMPDRLTDSATDTSVSLTISMLRRFILDPVAVVARHYLEIDAREDPMAEMADIEDAPIASPFPLDYQLRTFPVNEWLAGQLDGPHQEDPVDRLAAIFDAVYTGFLRKSRVPDGAFGSNDQARLKQDVMNYGTFLGPIIEQMHTARCCYAGIEMGAHMDVVRGGAALKMDPVSIALPQRGNDRQPSTAQLNGGIPWVWQTDDESWHCLVVSGAKQKHYPDRHVVGPLLTFMAISSGSVTGGDNPFASGLMTIHIAYQDGLKAMQYRVGPNRAQGYLADLIDDFCDPLPLLWLPFEAICREKALREAIATETAGGREPDIFFRSMTELHAENTDIQTDLAGAVVTPDILDHARRRLGIFVP
jgi:exodeoxyribonuclease V gamma subunit